MLNKITETIKKHNLLEKGDSVVVGVSGGPDSICLLHALYALKDVYNLKIAVVNLDHQFRGIESEKDSSYVKEFCEKLGIKAFLYSENIENYAKQVNKSFEEGARLRRYELFFKTKDIFGANKIAVAHNRNDQVETILMRLMRGTGIDGMLGIPYKRSDGVVRPLLDIDREEIERYCETNDLKPRIDATNLEAVYTRNKIRLELIPYIEENFNSNFKSTLLRNIITVRDDVAFLEQQVFDCVKEVVVFKKKEFWEVDISKFNTLHIAMKRRVLRQIVNLFNGERYDLSFKQVESILDMAQMQKTGKKRILPNGLLFYLNYDRLEISKPSSAEKDAQWEYPLTLSVKMSLEEAQIKVVVREIDGDEARVILKKKPPMVYVVDQDKIKETLQIRNRRKGDKFSPLGLKGTKKIKDYLIDLKVERDQRNNIPLICDGEGIVCVLGYQIDGRFKVTQETKRYLKIQYELF